MPSPEALREICGRPGAAKASCGIWACPQAPPRSTLAYANSASKVRPSDQPITRREKASNTTARYTNSRNSRR